MIRGFHTHELKATESENPKTGLSKGAWILYRNRGFEVIFGRFPTNLVSPQVAEIDPVRVSARFEQIFKTIVQLF